MTPLALGQSVAGIVIAALHLPSALGDWGPVRDEAGLARAVVGARDIARMPGAMATALVVVALLFAAALPWIAPGRLRLAGLVARLSSSRPAARRPARRRFKSSPPNNPYAASTNAPTARFARRSQPATPSSQSET